jgi:hypothetical protein
MAALEQQKAGENVLKLAADQKVRIICFNAFLISKSVNVWISSVYGSVQEGKPNRIR